MAERYDVIIIGSGAGGGTLAHRLAPSGKKILILERGDWLPREARNWSVDDVFGDNRYVSPETWYLPAAASRSSRRCTISSAAPPRCSAPRSTVCARRISASCEHYDGVSPAWPISYDELEPYYPSRASLPGARRHGSDPTRAAGQRTLSGRPVSNEPRIQKAVDDLAAAGYHPFPAPCGGDDERSGHGRTAAASAVRPATAFRASCTPKSDAEVIAVRPALEQPNVTLLRNAKALKLRDERRGTAVTGVVAEVLGSRSASRRHRRGVLRRREFRRAAAALGERQASGRPRQRFGSGRTQLHVPQQPGGACAVAARTNTMFQKTLALNDFYFGDGRLPLSDGQHPDDRQDAGRMYRAEKPLDRAVPTGLLAEWSPATPLISG